MMRCCPSAHHKVDIREVEVQLLILNLANIRKLLNPPSPSCTLPLAKQPLVVTERKAWWNPGPLWILHGKEKYHDPDGNGYPTRSRVTIATSLSYDFKCMGHILQYEGKICAQNFT
jgi:hypothetical protein